MGGIKMKKLVTAILVGLAIVATTGTVALAQPVVKEEAAGEQRAAGVQSVKLNTSIVNGAPGGRIVSKAVVTGDTTGLQYKFVYSYNNWEKFGVISHFSSKNTVSYKPAWKGKYEIYVDVKDKNGKIITKYNKVDINLDRASSMKVSKTTAKVGEPITITGSSTGANPQYKFVWNRSSWSKGNWGVTRNFSTTNKTSFVPNKPGRYELIADIKDSYGNTTSKKQIVTVTNNFSPSIKVTSDNPVSGGKIVARANATGKTKGLKYKFVYSYNNWEKFGVIRNFSEVSAVSFKPGKAGKYEIYVDVMDSSGNVITKSQAINITSGWKFNSISGVQGTTIGRPISLTANVSGNVSGLKYKFVYNRNKWYDWGVIANGASKTISYTPSYTGTYEIYVDIYDSYENVISKSVRFVVGTPDYTQAQLVPEMLNLVNKERARENLAPMEWDHRLDAAVLKRAKELSVLFSHNRPGGKLNGLGEIIARADGEGGTNELVMQAWMNSPGHRGHIMQSIPKDWGWKDTTIKMSAARYKNYWIIAFTSQGSTHSSIYLD